ncbi:transcription factor HES-2-like [Montipora foliosa]|uniref:transcription factor HES-2-like n=1 Tax=Montipora foliosa TaxID=591990 RepID=UPI0035F218E8
MDRDILKSVHSSQRNSKKDMKKSKKPLMEKMRRARINDSLNELKSLVLEAMKKDVSRYSKMEKADILEMAVKYLRSLSTDRPLHLQKQQDEAAVERYRAGFNDCAAKVSHILMTADNITVPVRTQLLTHLASSCQKQKDVSRQLPSELLLPRQQQSHATLPSFPAVSQAAGVNPTFIDANACLANKFPSPPSSPLHNQERKRLPLSSPMPSSMPPFVLSNGIPALILPNDAVQFLPLTLPNAPTPFDTNVWRPW